MIKNEIDSELYCIRDSFELAHDMINDTEYNKAIIHLNNAIRSLNNLQAIKNKQDKDKEKELNEILKLIYEDVALKKKALKKYE